MEPLWAGGGWWQGGGAKARFSAADEHDTELQEMRIPMNKSSRQDRSSPVLDISSAIAAFSEDQVAYLTGLSKGTLRRWARIGFYKPSFDEGNPRLPYSRFYSFRDVVALRTLQRLRKDEGISLQHLRKVADRLSHLGHELWARTELHVLKGEVCLIDDKSGHLEGALSGQFAPLSLVKMIEDTKADIIDMSRRPKEAEGRIERKREIAHNAWVVAGTRIPVAAIRRLHEDGCTIDQIIAEYPDLTRRDVDAALRHGDCEAA
jgi:uncharacterized protein (DUF433 family)